MKRIDPFQWRHLLFGGLLLFGLQLSASAGIFTWSAPAPITTADSMLNQSGTIVGGEVFGSTEVVDVLTNNSAIDFKADGSIAAVTAGGAGTSAGANTNQTGNYNLNAVLTQFNYDGGPKTITLNNLTVGDQYSVQLFALDDRGGSVRPANFQDPSDGTDISATFNMGDNVYVVGTFTAGSSSVNIQENLLNGGNGNINALVIRQLSGLPLAPQIVSQPQTTNIYNGLTAQISATAYGTALSYQWRRSSVGGSVFTNLPNGGRISGSTNLTLTITNLAAADTGDYEVVITNIAGSVTSSPPATLTVLPGSPLYSWAAPVMVTTADATLNQTGAVVGAEVFGTLETVVTLTNGTTLDFKADGSVAAVTGGGDGTASGAFSGTTGNAGFDAVLTQFNYDGGPKIVTLYNLTVGQQYTVQLFALDDRGNLSGAVRANYQDPNDVYDSSTLFAMGDNVYTIGTFTATSTSMNIQENLPDNGGGGNLNALVVRALGVVIPAQITSQPQSVTIDQGLNVSLTVAASGSTPFTYRWQRGAVGSGIFTNVPTSSRIFGQTTATLMITNLTPGDTADYRVVVNNVANVPTNSSVATLTVQAVTPQFLWSVPVAISTADSVLSQSGTEVGAEVFGPAAETVVLTNGTSVYFDNSGSVATATGGGTFTGAFSGDTSNATFNAVLNQASYESGYNPIVPYKTITLNNLVAGQQYAVQLIGLDDRGGTSTRTVNFQDPADQYDYSATFAMPANDYTIGTFTASASSVNIQENLFGSGGNINALVVYRLSGLPLAPQIASEPQSTSVASGVTAQFAVGATGTALTYQWQRAVTGSGNFSNVTDANDTGITTAQLTINGATLGNAADYRVIVSNGSGSATSSPAATLTVASPTLVHRWSFNETSGTTAHDSVGGADGTLQGGAAFTGNGYVNLPNPGSSPQTGNSYVSIPGGLLNSLSAVTMEFWVTNNGWNNGNTFMGFSGPIDGNGFGTNYINFYSRMFSSISAFEIATTAGDSGLEALGARYNNNSISSGIPDNYVYVYDPSVSKTISLWVNGTLMGSQTGVSIPLSSLGTSVGTIGLSVYNQSESYILPQNGGNKMNCPYLNGGISEVRIYNGALSSNAISDTFVAGPDQVPVAPQITTQPSSVAVYPGATAQFTVVASGIPLSYQWQRAAVGSSAYTNVTDANASGATTAQLTISNVTSTNAANYRVNIFNGSGLVTSATATLVLNVPSSLIHRWSFNETSGTTAHDSVGGADGTLQGGAAFTGNGYVNLPNPGSSPQTGNSYVSIPGGLLNSLSAVTMEFWVTNNGWNNGNTFMGFSGPIDGNGFGTNYINFYSRMFSSISAFEIATTAGDSGLANLGPRFNNNSISSGIPDHYVYIYDPTISQTISLYTNGVFSGSQPASVPLSSLGTSVGTIGLSVYNQSESYILPQNGGNKMNCPYLNGGISEVRIYSGVLSSNAIAATQVLGPDQLLSNNASLSVSNSAGNQNIVWPVANGAFTLVTSPVLGPGAVWTPVNITPTVVGSNYQLAIPNSIATAFFRLRQ